VGCSSPVTPGEAIQHGAEVFARWSQISAPAEAQRLAHSFPVPAGVLLSGLAPEWNRADQVFADAILKRRPGACGRQIRPPATISAESDPLGDDVKRLPGSIAGALRDALAGKDIFDLDYETRAVL